MIRFKRTGPAVLIGSIALLAVSPSPVYAAELKLDLTHCFVADIDFVHFSKEYRIGGFTIQGILRSNLKDSPFDNLTTACHGAGRNGGGTIVCKYSKSKADFMIIDGDFKKDGSGSFKITHGGGIWNGISGDGTWTREATGQYFDMVSLSACSKNVGTAVVPDKN